MKVSKNTSISKILQNYPKVNSLLKSYGLSCSKCLGADFEDLESIAKFNNVDLDLLLKEVDNLIE